MQPKPLTFVFEAPKAGKMFFHVADVSKSGAKIEVSINGTTSFTRDYPGGLKPIETEATVEVPFAAGKNEIIINNVGADWVNLDRYTFTGIAPLASIQAIRSGIWVLVWVHTLQPHVMIELSNFGTKSEVIAPTMWEIGALTKSQHDLERKDGWCGCVPPGRDTILMFES